jgi:AraC-like DNA-binding protein
VCTSGPDDRAFEERHSSYSVSMVLAGSFQYRSPLGDELMTPGSLMLGNANECFECGHEHGEGDRCIAFWYAPEYFERLAADAGARGPSVDFRAPILTGSRSLARMVASAAIAVTESSGVSWEELGVQIGAYALTHGRVERNAGPLPASAAARITRAVRAIDEHPDASHSLVDLARRGGLSPFHFLRTFQRLTGLTPHQYVLRSRLREAAHRLRSEDGRVLDVALDCGFGDVSNFNRSFRAEFGINPRRFRQTTTGADAAVKA